jgi:hypothetical protein
MLMLDSITITEVGGLVGIAAALLAGNAGLTSLLIDRKLRALNGIYVRVGECVLRTAGQDSAAQANREETRAACVAVALRDAATQERIDDIRNSIAKVAADAILSSDRVQAGIAELLARK